MARVGRLVRRSDGAILLPEVRWCASFGCKLRGLMFRRALQPGEGLLLVEGGESRAGTSIHMLFMAFPIAAIWLDGNFRVVDAKLAKPWRLAYAPARPARYILEAAPELLSRIEIGDELVFDEKD